MLGLSVFQGEPKMASDGERKPNFLQFVPLSSAVDAVFWHKLKANKLDVYQLDDKPRCLQGNYVNSDLPGLPCRLNIDYNAFELGCLPQRSFRAHGELLNTNTMEDFRSMDKQVLINSSGKKIWEAIRSKAVLEDPSLLCQFYLLTFANLKKYIFYYWFAIPALCPESKSEVFGEPLELKQIYNESQISGLQKSYEAMHPDGKGPGFFLVKHAGDSIELVHLKDIDNMLEQTKELMVGFADPSTMPSHPGWQLRNFLYFLAFHWGDKVSRVKVLCLRDRFRGGRRQITHSIVLDVSLPVLTDKECPKGVGWEKNKNQKLGPRHVDLSATMDPEKLAESSVDLNLKLMRWRLLPSLNLEVVSRTRCLLLGAGTLGCNVARCLLGWGVRTITFVDNGRISYSNPVRQCLFEFEDCKGNGQPKAEMAAKALKRIFPGVESKLIEGNGYETYCYISLFTLDVGPVMKNSSGEMFSIPMPGHAVGSSPDVLGAVQRDIVRLEELIDSHDVVFLLMDTRESRWLPTVISAAKKKLVITSALGFDTYLVMRHGAREIGKHDDNLNITALGSIPGSLLGCYFCNDVVAPGNSTRDRTLDQQCTVSRPGISYVAGALAVELMVSILQHPKGACALANTSAKDSNLTAEMESALGLVPHQIRGFLSRFNTVLPASLAFDKCIACSDEILTSYANKGFSFLLQAFNVPKYLEDLTGLTKLMQDTRVEEVWELSDEESMED